MEHRLYTTFLASAFRSLRFGLTDAHGKGMAMQVNYLMDKGGFVARPDGTVRSEFREDQGGGARPGSRSADASRPQAITLAPSACWINWARFGRRCRRR